MSDFLQFNLIDEVINGEPKYTITNNSDGTKNIELANEIIQQGTPLDKATFRGLIKLNSIIGYNVLNYTYEEEEIKETTFYGGQFRRGDIIKDYYNFNIVYEGSTVTDSRSINVTVDAKTVTLDSSYGDTIAVPNYVKSFTVSRGSTGTRKLSGSNDMETWTVVAEVGSSGAVLVNNTYKYYRATSGGTMYVGYFKSETYNVNYINDINFNFLDKQIINVITYINLPVSNNTFMEKQIDTILEPKKYYELLYDELQDKFIAEEVRA